jgi:hypothetical protein
MKTHLETICHQAQRVIPDHHIIGGYITPQGVLFTLATTLMLDSMQRQRVASAIGSNQVLSAPGAFMASPPMGGDAIEGELVEEFETVDLMVLIDEFRGGHGDYLY